MGKEAGGEAVGELLKKDGFTASQVEPVCDAIGGGFCNGVRSAEKWAARQIELATQPFYDGLEAVTDELYGAAGVVAEPLCRSQLPKNVCQGLGDAVEWVTNYLFFEGRLERLRGGFTGLIADEIDTGGGPQAGRVTGRPRRSHRLR